MDKTFYARSDFNKRAVVCHNDNFAFHLVANLQVWIQSVPWMWLELLQAEGDTLLLVVEVEDNNVELLVQFHNLVRVVYATPRKVCDVDQAVYAAKVDEYTVRSDVLDSSFQYLTFFQFGDDFFLLFQFSFDKSLVRYNNVFEFLVNFNHFEFHCFANEYIIVADRFNVDLRTRQECFDSEYVYDHTTLCAALDVTLDDFVVLESLVDAVPAACSACFLVREDQLTLFVFLVFDEYFNRVTNFQIRVVAEFAHRDDTI